MTIDDVYTCMQPDGVGSYAFGVGAPGTDYWTGITRATIKYTIIMFCLPILIIKNAGALVRRSGSGTINFQSTRSGSNYNDYQGYATAKGNFLTTTRQGTDKRFAESDELTFLRYTFRLCRITSKEKYLLWNCKPLY